MLSWKAIPIVVAAVSLLGCAGIDPGAPDFLVGAMPAPDGGVRLRIGSCLPGRLEEIVVAVDRESGSEELKLWRVTARPDEGPRLSSAGSVDVVIGTPPAGLVEREPLDRPLPQDEVIQVDIDLSSQSFGFFFRPGEMEADRFLVGRDETEDASAFADDLDDLCS